MNRIKKALVFTAILALSLALCACGGEQKAAESSSSALSSAAPTVSPTPTAKPTATPTPKPTSTPTPKPTATPTPKPTAAPTPTPVPTPTPAPTPHPDEQEPDNTYVPDDNNTDNYGGDYDGNLDIPDAEPGDFEPAIGGNEGVVDDNWGDVSNMY